MAQGHTSADVHEAVRSAEHARTKCIGLTIETRPDYCLSPHLTQMLSYGCTRLEIGLQSIYEDVARDTNRGHTVAAVADCFRLCKDAGFKVRGPHKREKRSNKKKKYISGASWSKSMIFRGMFSHAFLEILTAQRPDSLFLCRYHGGRPGA